jgi:hypothetical protein
MGLDITEYRLVTEVLLQIINRVNQFSLLFVHFVIGKVCRDQSVARIRMVCGILPLQLVLGRVRQLFAVVNVYNGETIWELDDRAIPVTYVQEMNVKRGNHVFGVLMMWPFDEYDLRARVFPALLVTLPIVALVVASVPSARSRPGAGIGTLIEGAALYFLARIARDRGVKVQPRLFDRWGGPPTTRMLRHENTLLDPVTKARLRSKLGAECGVAFPSAEAERQDPSKADVVYGSAVRALLERRRDKKRHRLIYVENCNYGFARNLFGIRWLGASIAAVCIALNASILYLQGFSFNRALSSLISVLVLLLITLYVNEGFVKRNAEGYALALLRSCEPGRTRAASKRKAEDGL